MNCFQNLLPLWYITTFLQLRQTTTELWIAFRIYYLCDTSQLHFRYLLFPHCCELLSEFITFVIHHNIVVFLNFFYGVVNCFQNLLPLWYITTIFKNFPSILLLWIAFRIYYLCDTSQQKRSREWRCSSCELLSEFITFVIHHNFTKKKS